MLVDFCNSSHVVYICRNALHTIVTDTGLNAEAREQLLLGKARLSVSQNLRHFNLRGRFI